MSERTLYEGTGGVQMIVDHQTGLWAHCWGPQLTTDAEIMAYPLTEDRSLPMSDLIGAAGGWVVVRDHIGCDPLLQVSEGL